MKENTKTAKQIAVLQRLKNTIEDVEDVESNETTTEVKKEPQSLKDRVVQELIADASGTTHDTDTENKVFSLPMKSDELVLDGAKESSLDDYEDIPISQFGLAMLRGMGLKDDDIKTSKSSDPELRPKGMGLGADKIAKPQKLLVAPAANEVLEIKKNAYVKILAGKHKNFYGQVSLQNIELKF